MLPESSQKKLNEGVVVSCGPGAVDTDGDVSLFNRTYLFVQYSLIVHSCIKIDLYTLLYIHVHTYHVHSCIFVYIHVLNTAAEKLNNGKIRAINRIVPSDTIRF